MMINRTVKAADLQVGMVIVGVDNAKGTCEVLTVPVLNEDGRVYFEGKDEKGRIATNRIQAGWDMDVYS